MGWTWGSYLREVRKRALRGVAGQPSESQPKLSREKTARNWEMMNCAGKYSYMSGSPVWCSVIWKRRKSWMSAKATGSAEMMRTRAPESIDSEANRIWSFTTFMSVTPGWMESWTKMADAN